MNISWMNLKHHLPWPLIRLSDRWQTRVLSDLCKFRGNFWNVPMLGYGWGGIESLPMFGIVEWCIIMGLKIKCLTRCISFPLHPVPQETPGIVGGRGGRNRYQQEGKKEKGEGQRGSCSIYVRLSNELQTFKCVHLIHSNFKCSPHSFYGHCTNL